MIKTFLDELWNKRTTSGKNPNVSTDSFGTAIRQGNAKAEELMRNMRAKREKEQQKRITDAAKRKSWEDAQKNKKRIFESLNSLYKI